jgi:hypothetical protein
MYRAVARITLLGLVMGLSACAVQPTGPRNQEPIPDLPGKTRPAIKPGSPSIPQAPAAAPKTSSNFAPPPGGNSHWDPRLGVHVLDDQADTFYRQRTYYRWSNGWTWSTSRNGPWQDTDASGVPAGLSRQFSN